jgi:hypothetical protein
MKVCLGRISSDLIYKKNWRQYLNQSNLLNKQDFIFGADTFYEADYNLLGVAFSWHWYDAYPLRERDIQLAFETIQATLHSNDREIQKGSTFLQKLLIRVSDAFAALNVPPENHHDVPMIGITLVSVEGDRLSIANRGGVDVYLTCPKGIQWLTEEWTKDFPEVGFLDTNLNPASINLKEVTVRPGDLVIVATSSMREVLAEANLSSFSNQDTCNPKAASQDLINIIQSQPGTIDDPPTQERLGRTTEYFIRGCGAAWAIASIGTFQEEVSMISYP